MSTFRFVLRNACFPLALACAAACGGDEAGNSGEPTVGGPIVNGTPPAESKVVIAWSVSSSSPDYAYKFGEGTAGGGKFVVTLPGPPPPEAINSNGLGIGFIALVDGNATIPEGVIDEDALAPPLGVSARHAVIWKADDATDAREWGADFPAGYSCGVCVPALEGEGHDSYAPTDCSKVELDMSEDREVCNWT